MSDYIRFIRTKDGDKQIDYNALANLPDLNNHSNAIKGNASGAMVRVDDVSPIEHTVKVKASGDVDLSTTTLTVCGKNLIDHNIMVEQATVYGVTVTRNGDVITLNGTLTTSSNLLNTVLCIYAGANKSYTLSYKHIDGTITGAAHICIGDSALPDDARQSWIALTLNNEDVARTYQTKKTYMRDIWLYCIGGVTFDNFTFKMQLEAGNTQTAYESYKGDTYTLNADGTCDVVSVSPVMTLLTDTDGVVIECEYERDVNTVIAELYALIGQGGGGSSSYITNVTLLAANWKGTASPYSQVVNVAGVTANSQVDLTPSVEQLSIFHTKDLTFVTENVGGVVTVYAIGQKPANDYTIQATITEVRI